MYMNLLYMYLKIPLMPPLQIQQMLRLRHQSLSQEYSHTFTGYTGANMEQTKVSWLNSQNVALLL